MSSPVFYVTARDAGRTALLAGPFSTGEAAARHTAAARAFLSSRSWRDTLGAFVPVGITEATPRGRAPRARFHAQIVGEV